VPCCRLTAGSGTAETTGHTAPHPATRSAGPPDPDAGTAAASATFSRNQEIDPPQPTHSAITVAGISGNSASSSRTRGPNGENYVVTGLRSYFGGTCDATARATVDLPIHSCLATCRCGTPSATSRRISAQSSTEITQPICLDGLIFDWRYGLIFERRRHLPGSSWWCHQGRHDSRALPDGRGTGAPRAPVTAFYLVNLAPRPPATLRPRSEPDSRAGCEGLTTAVWELSSGRS
jgi:hypothetical protein